MNDARLPKELSPTPIADELERIGRVLANSAAPQPPPTFDTQAYSAGAIVSLRRQWTARATFEHRSSTVFSQLALQLYEANAGVDFQVVMLRMAQDELRHAAACARVVEVLGGERPPADLELIALARHAGLSPQERALRNVLYTTSCSELVACARFAATLETTTDPYMRAALRSLLADEVLHAQYGFHYLTACQPWLKQDADARARTERFLTHGFFILERELGPAGPFAEPTDEERALGGDDPAMARSIFYETVAHAMVPGLERLGLGAERAWRERRDLLASAAPQL